SSDRWSRVGSGGQAGAALGTTGGEDGPAAAGAHARPEAVGLGATPVVGLESALHVCSRIEDWSEGGSPAGSALRTADTRPASNVTTGATGPRRSGAGARAAPGTGPAGDHPGRRLLAYHAAPARRRTGQPVT